jgi:predicted transglutaminase-like cysteine proteinase
MNRKMGGKSGILWALALATALLAPLGESLAKSKPSYFASTEVRRDNIRLFTKWTGMLKRFDEEKIIVRNCKPKTGVECPYDTWDVFIDKLGKQSVRKQIEVVNRHMNEARYIIDPINWGVEDYWATPGQFFFKEGDCEDYAIVKYMTLRRLGFDKDKMRIVVLQDLNLAIAHAVLVVQYKGQNLVLDNQISGVVKASSIHHYKPFYSINETAWWLHRT